MALLDRIVGRAKGPLLLVALPAAGPAFFGLCARCALGCLLLAELARRRMK